MKILFYAWNIYDKDLPEIQIAPNGGSIAIRNIVEYVARKEEVYLFLGKTKMSAKRLHHINIIDTKKYPDYAGDVVDEKERWLRTMEGAFRDTIRELNPDFVNLHGGGALLKRCILVCQELGVKYANTNHLYIGSGKKNLVSEQDFMWEQEIFSIPGIKVTTVGTTSKKNILNDYPNIKENDVDVILNGTDFKYEINSTDLRDKLNLQNKKILLCSGTINNRKNQLQLVHSFAKMNEGERETIAILFCGKDRMDGALQREIAKYGLQNSLIYLGVVPNDEMKKYYSIADGYILISLAEGLSLTMLEAMVYGLPLIMFDDVEGASDLRDDKVSLFIHGKENKDVTDAIIKWAATEWDKDYIQEYARYFNMDRVADDYIAYYKKRINSTDS